MINNKHHCLPTYLVGKAKISVTWLTNIQAEEMFFTSMFPDSKVVHIFITPYIANCTSLSNTFRFYNIFWLYFLL